MHNIQELLTRAPQLIEHFISLEGEGITVGRSALFIRTNQCNLSCAFCDTSFSIKGNHPFLVADMTTDEYVHFLKNHYSMNDRDNISNLSITGGEPLLNLNHFNSMIKKTLEAFPKIDKIVIETNGYLLKNEIICFKLIEQVGEFFPNIHFILSISPKLSGKVSHAGKETDADILNNYHLIIKNYRKLLDAHFDIQLKMVHSKDLVILNEGLISYVVKHHLVRKDQILIMPFTPLDPTGKNQSIWTASKNDSAAYALKNHFRYSPRIHIDRNLS